MNITEKANKKINELLEQKNAEGIRFYSMGAGCCGPQLGISLDAPGENDIIEEIDGIQVAIDKEVKDTVAELTLDNEETLEGSHFTLLGMDQCC
ncbi:HesB/IscA family protein [Sediminibacillus halophilus]|uniref:Fe-S cluster assembly iron-binding protein IscA n=1 Tax=Sediminibacillus halophilus TaxID=482461 RepID=A0A1G9WC34_9BACI|nr:adhesin [Sediminibacillus halophilus]SDM82134.1 Fe-S cluster assembly iron-binding protein IscA [Sediminibacillus halophilus]